MSSLTCVMITWVYTYVKVYQTVHVSICEVSFQLSMNIYIFFHMSFFHKYEYIHIFSYVSKNFFF